MNSTVLKWMTYSIDIANKYNYPCLKVGAVIATNHNELVTYAFSGAHASQRWSSILVEKVKRIGVKKAGSLYLTVNTFLPSEGFDLCALLKEISFDRIYIGLPDPQLCSYVEDDPILSCQNIFRYPDKLQMRILEQNKLYYESSTQNICNNPYFSQHRIGNYVLQKLDELGYKLTNKDLQENTNLEKLADILCEKYDIAQVDARETICFAVSSAFDSKYGTYNYSNDTRACNTEWKNKLLSLHSRIFTKAIFEQKILNVGVGSGEEAESLFSECSDITFVDIAKTGLERIKESFPHGQTYVCNASRLENLLDNTFDLYISLRTYNSAFFDVERALGEAYRVLKDGGGLIVSVANGFLGNSNHQIIPGLIIPGTEFVDIYRGMEKLKEIYRGLVNNGFCKIEVIPTITELYISAKAYKKY